MHIAVAGMPADSEVILFYRHLKFYKSGKIPVFSPALLCIINKI